MRFRLLATALFGVFPSIAVAQHEHEHGDEHPPGGVSAQYGPYPVSREASGTVHDLPGAGGLRIGIGAPVSRYNVPNALKPAYGDPASFMIFARMVIR